MTLANAPREIKRRAWTMRNAELTCLDKEDDARQQSEQTDPRFRLLQSEGDGVPKRWPDRITGRASARRRWSWLRRGRCGGFAGCGSEAGAVVPRTRLREHNNPESTRRWEGSDFRSSEGGGMEWKQARWKWKDGEREGNRERQEGWEPPRRELPPPVGSVLVDATDGLEPWAFWAGLCSAPHFLRP